MSPLPLPAQREHRIQAQQARLLYRGFATAIAAGLLNAGALAFIEWPVVHHDLLLAWLGASILVAVGRGVLALTFHYRRARNGNTERWIRLSELGTLLAALIWGAAGVIFFSPDYPSHQLFLALVIAGVTAGSVTSLAPVWSCVSIFLTFSLAPLTFMFLNQGTRLDLTVGLLAILFYLVLISGARRIYQNIRDNIALRVDSEPREQMLRQSVSALESLHAITADTGLSFDDKVTRLLRLGIDTFDLPIGIVSRIENDVYTVRYAVSPNAEVTPGMQFALGDTYCTHTLKSTTPVAIHHVGASRIKNHPCYEKFLLEAYLGVPLLVNGQPYGTLNFSSTRPRAHPFSQQEVSLIQLLAHWIGNELSRRILASERDAFFNVSLDLLCIADSEGYFKQLNPAWQKVLGYSENELKSRPFVEFVHPDDRESTMIESRKLAGGRDTIAFENRYRHRDGNYRWLTWTATPDPASGLIYAVARDITEQREAELRLEKQAHEAILMQRGLSIANETGSFQSALQQCVDLVCSTLDWPVGHALLPAPEPNSALRSGRIWHLKDPDRFRDFRRRSEEFEFSPGTGLPGRIWQQRVADWVEDIGTDPHLPRAAVCADAGLRSAIGFPILVSDKVEAVLEFFHDRAIAADSDLLRTLTTLGSQLGRVLERRRAAEAIAESEERNRLLLDSAGEGIYGLDINGRTTFVNDAAARMLGYEARELIDKSMHETVHHSYPNGSPYPLDQCPIHHTPTGIDVERMPDEVLWRRDGSSFPIEYTSTPIYKGGELVGAVVTFRDVTERNKIDRMKNEFISTVSHELRTPLTSIRGSLGLLAGGVAGQLPEQARSLVDIACSNSDRLIRLINDILDIEKIESGMMQLDMQPLDLNRLVKQTVEANRIYAQQFGVDLETRTPPGRSEVAADHDRLTQVITNLLSNAIKFSPHGGVVTVIVKPHNGKIRVAISDHGPGIPREFQEHLFEKFTQAEASDNRRAGGTGLGLSISRAIVQELGGDIGFETSPTGTTMYFDLPQHSVQTGKGTGIGTVATGTGPGSVR